MFSTLQSQVQVTQSQQTELSAQVSTSQGQIEQLSAQVKDQMSELKMETITSLKKLKTKVEERPAARQPTLLTDQQPENFPLREEVQIISSKLDSLKDKTLKNLKADHQKFKEEVDLKLQAMHEAIPVEDESPKSNTLETKLDKHVQDMEAKMVNHSQLYVELQTKLGEQIQLIEKKAADEAEKQQKRIIPLSPERQQTVGL